MRLLLWVTILSATCAWAQNAVVTGNVLDSTGAAIPNAKVTIRNVATGVATSTETKAEGSFYLPPQPPGSYSLQAEAVGFATGGYTSNGLHPSLDAKIMPILSNSLVTRPLTPAELEATNFRTTEVITDTRTLPVGACSTS